MTAGTKKEWTLPEPQETYTTPSVDTNVVAAPITMSQTKPLEVVIPIQIKSYLTYESKKRTLIWIDDPTAEEFVGTSGLKISITLTNSIGDQAKFEQKIDIKSSKRTKATVA